MMFIFGSKDRLVGDPGKAEALVRDIPGVTVKTVDTGHLVAAEQPAEVNRLLIDFFRTEN